MTNVTLKLRNENIISFEVSGHTGYDNAGKDIVCAAISSITQSACLGIVKVLKINAQIKKNDKQGYLKLTLPENISNEMLDKAQIILNTMKISLQDLLFDYGDYIKLEEIR